MRRFIFTGLLIISIAICAGRAFGQVTAPPIPYGNSPYSSAQAEIEDMKVRLAQMEAMMAKKADKPAPAKGFSAPKIGGRFFLDQYYVLNQNDDSRGAYLNGHNNTRIREARITATGTGYGFLDYKIEAGFEKSSQVSLKDVYLGIQNVPILEYVRVGNQYVEDAGSEICNGTTNYTFMEAPSPGGNQFTSRRVGISSRHLFNNDRGRLFLGVYDARNISDTKAYKGGDSHGVMLNGRFTYAPMFQQDGRCMFLYGAYYSYTSDYDKHDKSVYPGGFDVDIKTLNTGGEFSSDAYHKAGFELVYQYGELCLQTDWYVQKFTNVNTVGGDDCTNYGGFVMARYFLTPGDYRKYNKQAAAWGAVNVCRPFVLIDHCGVNYMKGCGAWEIAAVYGYGDYDDFGGTSTYGTDHELGLALNWYWNSQVKWCFNYIHQMSDVTRSNRNFGSASSDIIGVSCRVSF